MFNKTRKEREEYIINWLGRLEGELDRLVEIVEDNTEIQKNLSNRVVALSNRVVAMDYTLEVHEMDLEYLKANMKTKKKGNK